MIKIEALKVPIQIFIILERAPFYNFTSKINYFNCFFFNLRKKQLPAMASLFKKELFLSNSYIIDIVGYERQVHKKYKKILFYIFYSHYLNLRLFSIINLKSKLRSISKSIKSAAWLEREVKEMLDFKVLNISDSRNLLLDYNFKAGVLKKKFSTNLNENIFFNSVHESVDYTRFYNINL